MTLQDHVIKRLCDFIERSSSVYIPKYVVNFVCRPTSQNYVVIWLCDFMGRSHSKSVTILKKLSKPCLKLYQFVSVGVGINDGPFLSKDCFACDESLLLKLIAFWSGNVVLASSIIFLSFSRYNKFHWLLWCLRFDFLNLLFFRGWSK